MIAVIYELLDNDVYEHLIVLVVYDLLQRVVPDDARRVLDYVIKYVYAGGFGLCVVYPQSNLERR